MATDESLPFRLMIRVALLTFVAILPAISAKFINGDDDVNFLENLDFRGLGWEQLRWAWSTTLIGVYQPIAWMLFEAQYALWGLGPRGYHFVSLTLHALNAAVLFALTATLVERCRPDLFADDRRRIYWASAMAVALFSIHPLRVEVVSWASCQPYLPCALFSMLSILAYLRAQDGSRSRRSSWAWWAGAFAFYAAAVLSKPPAVCLPAVLLILDVYPLRRLGRGEGLKAAWFGREAIVAWAEKVPFVALALALTIMTIDSRQSMSGGDAYPLNFRIARASYGVAFYLVKTVVPAGLTAFYPFPLHFRWAAPQFASSIAFVVVASVAAFRFRRRVPGLVAAWAAYLVVLAPTSGLIPMKGGVIAADRYSYLAMMVWVAPAAVGLSWLIRRAERPRRRVGLATAMTGIVLGLTVLSWLQCATWMSSEALWTNALEHGGEESSAVLDSLALAYAQEGLLPDAEHCYTRAVEINPIDPLAQHNLGTFLFNQRRPSEGIPYLLEAIRLDPNLASAYRNLGWAFLKKDKPMEAAFFFRKAALLKLNGPEIRNNLGMPMLDQGRYTEAEAEFQADLKSTRDNEKVLHGLEKALGVGSQSPSPALARPGSDSRADQY